jgi:hypothetical protein
LETIRAFIEREDVGSYGVYVDLDNKTLNYGIHGNGKTAKEAVEDFIAAYVSIKEYHKQKGKKFAEAKFEYVYDTASFLAYYSKVL